MGAAQSIPPDPVPDPNIFINMGCVGLDTLANNSNRLASAPFLYVNFQATNYNEMIYNILTTFQKIKPGWTPTPSNNVNMNLDLNLGDIKNKAKKKNKADGTSSNDDDEEGATYTTPGGTTYRNSGYDNEVEMQKRLTELATYIMSKYAQFDEENNRASDVNGVYGQKGATLNGFPLAYWKTKYVYGPVYLLAAKDFATNRLDCYLYFPSMTKDCRLWPNLNFLGLAHNWMHLLLYGASSRIQWCNSNDQFAGMATVPYYVGQRINPCENGTRQCTNWDQNHPNPCMNGYTNCKMTNNKMPYRDFHNFFGVYTGTAYYPDSQTVSDRFMFGCKPHPYYPFMCQQSPQAHMGMGLYDEYKSKNEYPVAYYHAYALRFSELDTSVYANDATFVNYITNHILYHAIPEGINFAYNGDSYVEINTYVDQLRKIKSYVNQGPNALQSLTNSLFRGASCGLAQNILPAHTKLLQGCTTGLISQNNAYYLIVGANNFTLYTNYYDTNLSLSCPNGSFWGLGVLWNIPFSGGGYNSYVTIEEKSINIYSSSTPNDAPMVVKTFQFKVPKTNASNAASNQFSLVLNDKGELLVINANNELVANFSELVGLTPREPYDRSKDYARRLLNLKNFLILKKIYIDVPLTEVVNPPKQKKQILRFNSNTNYIMRMYELLMYFASQNKIDPDAAKNYRQSIINQTGMDVNGLIDDNAKQKQSATSTKVSNTNSLSSQIAGAQSQQLGRDMLGVDTGAPPPKQKDVAKSANTSYKNKIAMQQAEIDSKTNNESNPNNPTCPKPTCMGSKCPPQESAPEIVVAPATSGSTKSLASLHDIKNTSGLFTANKNTATQLNIQPRKETSYQVYLRQRLEALKTYFEIQKHIKT